MMKPILLKYYKFYNDGIYIFSYETGAEMIDNMIAPARRVGFMGQEGTYQYFNDDAWKIFDNMVAWALE
ncbi:MAG: hypothetical protein GY870_07405 [archaeon]|nr:hypothetical protein [archaeon]